MPIRIAVDARLISSANTGDTQYWRGLISGLLSLPDDFLLLLFSNGNRPATIPDDPRLVWITLPNRHSRLWSLLSFPLAARQYKADVAHGQYNMSPFFGRRSVTTIHDVSFFVEPTWFKPKDRLILRAQIPATVRRVGHVLTVSETSRKEIERYIPAAKGKISVTYNALGTNISPIPAEEAKILVAQKFGLTGPFFVTAGTRWPRKNMGLVVEMARLWPAQFPHQFVICGKAGWGEGASNARVIQLGYVSDQDLSALLCAADAYICPSLHEGFGIPLLEAWACHIPVICGNGGALPEVAGDAALVIPNYEAAAWVDSLSEFMQNSGKLDSMKQAARSRLLLFNWEESARKTLGVYRQVAGNL